MFGARPLPRTLEAAVRDATSTKPAVRAEAVRQLVPHAEEARERVIRTLEKALRDEVAEVRVQAVTGLADLAAVEALPALLLAVEDDAPLVRQMALTALGEIGDPRATERIRRALSDERADVRFQAVIAYPRVSASREAALDALVDATFDKDPLVAHIALRMAEEVSQGDEEKRAPVGPRFLERARALVGKGDPTVRVAAAILLAHAKDRGGDGVLDALARGELKTSDPQDEAEAIELAGELGLTGAKPGLEKRAWGGLLGLRRDRFAWHARVALARMGHERAEREILKELESKDRDRCTLAVAAAGRAKLVAAKGRLEELQGNERRADPTAVADALAAIAEREDRS